MGDKDFSPIGKDKQRNDGERTEEGIEEKELRRREKQPRQTGGRTRKMRK